MLVISSLAAPRRGRRKRGKHARLTGTDPDPRELPATRATAVRADRLDDEAAAEAWLAELTRDPEARDAFVAEALILLNTALHAQRAATLDPYVNDLGSHDPVATRVGYGDGDELAAGRWTKAVDAPPDPGRRVRRTEALRPQERLAAVLGGRDRIGRLRDARPAGAPRRRRRPLARGGATARARGASAARRARARRSRGSARGPRRDPRRGSRARAISRSGRSAVRWGRRRTRSLEDLLELCERVLRRRQILG